MTEVTVRRARQDDVPRLASWNAQLIRDEQNDAGAAADDIEPRLREWLAKDYVACVFEAGGTGFGYSIFRDLPDCVHLRHFFVEEAGDHHALIRGDVRVNAGAVL